MLRRRSNGFRPYIVMAIMALWGLTLWVLAMMAAAPPAAMPIFARAEICHYCTSANTMANLSGAINVSEGIHASDAIVINEILAHSDVSDAVELLNLGEVPVDISGWMLTDDLAKAQSLWARIPEGTVLAPGAYYVSWQVDENHGNWSFGLSEAGETLYLLRPNPAGGPPLLVQQVSFGASPNDVSFIRYVDSVGRVHYPLQAGRPTLGAPNRGPRQSLVVIEEIMYHPPAGGQEYVVIANISNLTVPLYHPTFQQIAWKFVGQDQNGGDHDMLVFPTGLQLAPHERIILTEGDPAALRQQYEIPETVRISRWQRGGLNNRRERIALMAPQPPEIDGTVNYVVADAVGYNYDAGNDLPLWPDASGNGLALARVDGWAFGNDPANWRNITPLRKVSPRLYLPWVSQ